MVMLDPSLSNASDLTSLNVADSMAIATAFRHASDEDTRSVLNAMSNPSSAASLQFFMISVQWTNTCLPYLLGETDQRPRVKITNAPLLDEEHAVSSSSSSEEETDMNERKRRLRRIQWEERQRQYAQQNLTIRPGLVLDEDFVLFGKHVWEVVSSKFGYDVELARPCVVCNTSTSRLAVVLYEGTLIPVPPSGRFSYGSSADKPAVLVPPQPQDTDVVSEDDQELTDLFPGSDYDKKWSPLTPSYSANATADADSTILMLPPSTTTSASSLNARLSPDDMDFSPKRKRYASGLGNLGNTCFMNSTLQCLAHTDPLRRYFVSGEYRHDLNRDNPLGTGGELATQFAELLTEMWKNGGVYNVSYPRNFKYALGKHAEQFLGYDQHDSQEFATYLLDALHEDTNRVTKKPYVEKPEQKEDETDDEAAEAAWKLHLRREDSRVLENFMGQVKSRVQCPTEGCGRVSTTFDPFMYLSVPIPGATDRSLQVTLVPLDGQNVNLTITLNKSASIATLQKKVAEQWLTASGKEILVENMGVVDVWNNQVYTNYLPNDDVDRIRENDTTFIYELRSTAEILSEEEKEESDGLFPVKAKSKYRRHCYKLDLDTITKLNTDDEWIKELEGYLSQVTLLSTILNVKRSSHEDRVAFYQKLESFIDLCHSSSDGHSIVGSSEDADMDTNGESDDNDSRFEALPSLMDRCQSSSTFRNVESLHDLVVLEFCSKKLRAYITRLAQESKNKYREGIPIQILMNKRPTMASPRVASYGSSSDKSFTAPLCLRIPPNMTVYGLREELAHRLGRVLKTDYLGHPPPAPPTRKPSGIGSANPNESPDEMASAGSENHEAPAGSPPRNMPASSDGFGSPELLIMRQIPLTYERKSATSYKPSYSTPRQLGMLERLGSSSFDGHPVSLATREDEAEQQLIADIVGPLGTIHMNWTTELCERSFDVDAYEAAEDIKPADESTGVRTRNATKKAITVSDCIEKYCQMEQLDESEMWYCNRCKEHVRAWKQFHLYRAPPILIVHLKRFQYSASTHRRDKIDTFIDFPLTGLDLTNEVMHWTEEEKPVYDCYAVSNHYGGLGGGHYTAYALSDEGDWCHFDDSRVSTGVDPKEVISSAAYVLYYRRRDVVLDGKDGIMGPPVPAIVQDPYFRTRNDDHPLDETDANGDLRLMDGGDVDMDNCSSPMGSIDPTDQCRYQEEDDDAGFDTSISTNLVEDESTGLPLQ